MAKALFGLCCLKPRTKVRGNSYTIGMVNFIGQFIPAHQNKI